MNAAAASLLSVNSRCAVASSAAAVLRSAASDRFDAEFGALFLLGVDLQYHDGVLFKRAATAQQAQTLSSIVNTKNRFSEAVAMHIEKFISPS